MSKLNLNTTNPYINIQVGSYENLNVKVARESMQYWTMANKTKRMMVYVIRIDGGLDDGMEFSRAKTRREIINIIDRYCLNVDLKSF